MFYKNVFFLKHFVLKILSDLSEVGNRTFKNYRYKSEVGVIFHIIFVFMFSYHIKIANEENSFQF